MTQYLAQMVPCGHNPTPRPSARHAWGCGTCYRDAQAKQLIPHCPGLVPFLARILLADGHAITPTRFRRCCSSLHGFMCFG
jgi:hypothetical protein